VIETFISHVFGEGARVGSETGNADANVVVDGEDLFLVRGQFGDGTF